MDIVSGMEEEEKECGFEIEWAFCFYFWMEELMFCELSHYEREAIPEEGSEKIVGEILKVSDGTM